jgi:hypothetical protein
LIVGFFIFVVVVFFAVPNNWRERMEVHVHALERDYFERSVLRWFQSQVRKVALWFTFTYVCICIVLLYIFGNDPWFDRFLTFPAYLKAILRGIVA